VRQVIVFVHFGRGAKNRVRVQVGDRVVHVVHPFIADRDVPHFAKVILLFIFELTLRAGASRLHDGVAHYIVGVIDKLLVGPQRFKAITSTFRLAAKVKLDGLGPFFGLKSDTIVTLGGFGAAIP
jgi:hypothetical protein